MPAFVKIKALYDTLSLNEQKLASHILGQPEVIRGYSSQQLANEALVSQSSVVKFTQKLGYKGYPAFKLAVIDALNSEDFNKSSDDKITLSDNIDQLSEKLHQNKISVLNETKNINESHSIAAAMEIIDQAQRILVCGLGGSALVGKDFSYKLQKIGKASISELDIHAQLASIASYNENDVIFVISESGSTTELNEICQQARYNNCKIISLTKFADNPVSIQADVKLFSVAERDSIRLSSILARTSQQYVIDMIFIALTQASEEKRKYLQKINSIMAKIKRS